MATTKRMNKGFEAGMKKEKMAVPKAPKAPSAPKAKSYGKMGKGKC